MRWLVLALVLSGCGASAPAYAAVLSEALETFRVLLDERGGPQGAVQCEHEVVPPKGSEPGRLLVLCEAELGP